MNEKKLANKPVEKIFKFLFPLSTTDFVAGNEQVETSCVFLLNTDGMEHFVTLAIYSRSVTQLWENHS